MSTSQTEWEPIENNGTKCGGYGGKWQLLPAVAINKTGITLNGVLMDLWSKGSTQVLLFRKDRLLGIKFVPRGEEVSAAFNLQFPGSNSKAHSARSVKNTKFMKEFPDCLGKAYFAEMHANNRIIQVMLSPDNKV